MRDKNPYTLTFGKSPYLSISRPVHMNSIINDFLSEEAASQIYLITGVRGSGKTVLMTDIARRIEQKSDWIVVELNPESDILRSLAAKLCSIRQNAEIFRAAKINLSLFGLGIEIDREPPIADMETAVIRMMESLKNQNKKVLVTIDEVTNTKQMRVFSGAFQIFVRHDLPVYLLMTGLYESIDALQNEDNLTFLYRAPKIHLKPLPVRAVADKYEQSFAISQQRAKEMALMTKGYPFAFQVLGYLSWENEGAYETVLSEYRQYLDEYVYEKLWAELSPKDKDLAYAIATAGSSTIKDIRAVLGIETNQFNPYRKRLIRKGLINGEERGHLYFSLPLFEEFVKDNY